MNALAMRRRTKVVLFAVASIAIAVAIVPAFIPPAGFFRITKIESLKDPVSVAGWTSNNLLLADGRRLVIPNFRSLPSNSVALSEITKRGVEIGDGGRVYGLVRVHHWCGNDPVREHIARVDISDALTFLRVGETDGPVPEAEFRVHKPGGSFSEWGWRVGEFYQFESWKKLKDAVR
jgi:hypothetical protein